MRVSKYFTNWRPTDQWLFDVLQIYSQMIDTADLRYLLLSLTVSTGETWTFDGIQDLLDEVSSGIFVDMYITTLDEGLRIWYYPVCETCIIVSLPTKDELQIFLDRVNQLERHGAL